MEFKVKQPLTSFKYYIVKIREIKRCDHYGFINIIGILQTWSSAQ